MKTTIHYIETNDSRIICQTGNTHFRKTASTDRARVSCKRCLRLLESKPELTSREKLEAQIESIEPTPAERHIAAVRADARADARNARADRLSALSTIYPDIELGVLETIDGFVMATPAYRRRPEPILNYASMEELRLGLLDAQREPGLSVGEAIDRRRMQEPSSTNDEPELSVDFLRAIVDRLKSDHGISAAFDDVVGSIVIVEPISKEQESAWWIGTNNGIEWRGELYTEYGDALDRFSTGVDAREINPLIISDGIATALDRWTRGR